MPATADRAARGASRYVLPVALLLLLTASAGFAGKRILQSYPAPAADGLITNEFAFWHRSNPGAKQSPEWEMTSGSLFARKRLYWTGRPDSCGNGGSPNLASTNCTDSNVFRLNTVRRFAGPIAVSISVRQLAEIHDQSCDVNDSCWHGTHLWLRYQNQYNLYYASINRADGKVAIKRKVPCGSDNSGTYFALSPYVRHDFRTRAWNSYVATIETNGDASVTIKLYDTSYSRTRPIVIGTDRGGRNPNWSPQCTTEGRYPSALYPPITAPGAVGIRGDFANFEFSGFQVSAL